MSLSTIIDKAADARKKVESAALATSLDEQHIRDALEAIAKLSDAVHMLTVEVEELQRRR